MESVVTEARKDEEKQLLHFLPVLGLPSPAPALRARGEVGPGRQGQSQRGGDEARAGGRGAPICAPRDVLIRRPRPPLQKRGWRGCRKRRGPRRGGQRPPCRPPHPLGRLSLRHSQLPPRPKLVLDDRCTWLLFQPRLRSKEPGQGREGPPRRGPRGAHCRLAHADRAHADGAGSTKTPGPESAFPHGVAVTSARQASRCADENAESVSNFTSLKARASEFGCLSGT